VQDFYDTVTKPGERPFAGTFLKIFLPLIGALNTSSEINTDSCVIKRPRLDCVGVEAEVVLRSPQAVVCFVKREEFVAH
jgi:hypothetical protein